MGQYGYSPQQGDLSGRDWPQIYLDINRLKLWITGARDNCGPIGVRQAF